MNVFTRNTQLQKRQPGFTLTELLVSLSVIGILSVIVAPTFHHALIRSQLASVLCKSRQISTAYIHFLFTHPTQSENKKSVSQFPGFDIAISTNNSCEIDDVFRKTIAPLLNPSTKMDPFASSNGAQIQFCAILKKELNHLFPFQEASEPGHVLTSWGPDRHLEQFTVGLQYEGLVYNVSNGIQSCGDIFINIPQQTFPRFQ